MFLAKEPFFNKIRRGYLNTVILENVKFKNKNRILETWSNI